MSALHQLIAEADLCRELARTFEDRALSSTLTGLADDYERQAVQQWLQEARSFQPAGPERKRNLNF